MIMNVVDRMLKYVIKHWYVVLLFAIVGAVALYVEKAQVAPSVAVNGNLLYTRIVKFEPVPYVSYGGEAKEIDVTGVITSWRAAHTFFSDMENNVDIEKICIGWGNLNLNERMNWVEKHVRFIKIGPGLYELEIRLAATDGKDTAYVEENYEKMMDSYVETVRKTANPIINNSQIKVVDTFNLADTRQEVTQAGLQKKYIIVGFVLGGLVGMAILALLSLRAREGA